MKVNSIKYLLGILNGYNWASKITYPAEDFGLKPLKFEV
jgi:hypothetical protein